jgi:hypothetical protein
VQAGSILFIHGNLLFTFLLRTGTRESLNYKSDKKQRKIHLVAYSVSGTDLTTFDPRVFGLKFAFWFLLLF